jgi:RimJ/RimL family protein N-acetyltransferase
MSRQIVLRPATLDDAALLMDWRNDPRTRAASHHTEMVQKDRHLDWLRGVLANPDRQLFVALDDGEPVGTVRADLDDGIHEFSWTVAPGARGRGIGKRMVALLAGRIETPIRAEIKSGNTASIRIAEHAGMLLDRQEDGVLHYLRR